MTLTIRQDKLLEFVIRMHGEQNRKYTGKPYWTHPYAVAEIISHYNYPMAIEIALCHDLFEDTPCTKDELIQALYSFGYKEVEASVIASGTEKLTDEYTPEKYPDLNRNERKRLEAQRFTKIVESIQSIKVADLIDNTSSIMEHDPGFGRIYLQEAVELLSTLRKANIWLVIRLSAIINNYMYSNVSVT